MIIQFLRLNNDHVITVSFSASGDCIIIINPGMINVYWPNWFDHDQHHLPNWPSPADIKSESNSNDYVERKCIADGRIVVSLISDEWESLSQGDPEERQISSKSYWQHTHCTNGSTHPLFRTPFILHSRKCHGFGSRRHKRIEVK